MKNLNYKNFNITWHLIHWTLFKDNFESSFKLGQMDLTVGIWVCQKKMIVHVVVIVFIGCKYNPWWWCHTKTFKIKRFYKMYR